MKAVLFLMFALFVSPLQGEVIKNVEYQLPQSEEWILFNKMEGKKEGTTLVYLPKSADSQNSHEFFGVNANNISSDANDIDSFRNALGKLFPTMNVEASIVEKWPNSALFEWFASNKKDNKIVVKGWTRVFTKEGTISINYTTANMEKLDETKAKWLPILKNAHYVESK